MASSTCVFVTLFALLVGSTLAQSPGPASAASPAHQLRPTRTFTPPSSKLSPSVPPKISSFHPTTKSQPPALAPTSSLPAPPTTPITSPAASIIPPTSIANPPELNPLPTTTRENGAASNSVGSTGCVAVVFLVVAVTM